jgi:hypothetical protein
VHAINFVSLPWPSRRRLARTRTHATEGPSPLLHLSMTVSTFHHAVAANPNAPAHVCLTSHRLQVRTFLAASTLNTASPKSAHIFSLCRCGARTVSFVSPRGQAADVCTSANACTRGVEPLCSPCPTHVRTPARVRLCLPSRTSAHARTNVRERATTPAWTP